MFQHGFKSLRARKQGCPAVAQPMTMGRMQRLRTAMVLWLLFGVSLATGQDYQFKRELRTESPAERSIRHELIAKRRVGPMIIVHRGASSIAPENTLEAYAAAMDFGADGCEVDLRLTRD